MYMYVCSLTTPFLPSENPKEKVTSSIHEPLVQLWIGRLTTIQWLIVRVYLDLFSCIRIVLDRLLNRSSILGNCLTLPCLNLEASTILKLHRLLTLALTLGSESDLRDRLESSYTQSNAMARPKVIKHSTTQMIGCMRSPWTEWLKREEQLKSLIDEEFSIFGSLFRYLCSWTAQAIQRSQKEVAIRSLGWSSDRLVQWTASPCVATSYSIHDSVRESIVRPSGSPMKQAIYRIESRSTVAQVVSTIYD